MKEIHIKTVVALYHFFHYSVNPFEVNYSSHDIGQSLIFLTNEDVSLLSFNLPNFHFAFVLILTG